MIGSYIICGPGEADRYLEQVLQRTLPLVDWMLVCLNNGTDKERALLNKYSVPFVEDSREWGKEQWVIKEHFYKKHILPKNPDWLICIDADEILDLRITKDTLVSLQGRGEIAYEFLCVQLWDKEDRARVDGGWGGFYNVRYFKNLPDVEPRWVKSPLHCGLAPEYAYKWRATAEYAFIHYGYLKAEDRIRKAERYKKYDPNGVMMTRDFYWRIEHSEVGEYVSVEKLLNNIHYRAKQPNQQKLDAMAEAKKKQERILYVRNKHGIVYSMKESLAREALKRGLELVGEVPSEDIVEQLLAIKEPEGTSPSEIIEEPKEEEEKIVVPEIKEDEPTEAVKEESYTQFVCEVCQKGFHSNRAVETHKRFAKNH